MDEWQLPVTETMGTCEVTPDHGREGQLVVRASVNGEEAG